MWQFVGGFCSVLGGKVAGSGIKKGISASLIEQNGGKWYKKGGFSQIALLNQRKVWI